MPVDASVSDSGSPAIDAGDAGAPIPGDCGSGAVLFDGHCAPLPPPNPVGTATEPAYGFDYIPSGFPNWITTDFATCQDRVAKDIGLMKSMGISVIRISVWGFGNGLPPWVYDQPAGTQYWDLASFDMAAANLPEIVKWFGTARIRVILVFAPNNYWNSGPVPDSGGWPSYVPVPCHDTTMQWWQCRYPNRWSDFAWDYLAWINGLAWQVENDPDAAPNILYYDALNELQYTDNPGTDMKSLIDVVIGNNNIPSDKLGFSILNPVASSSDVASLSADSSAQHPGPCLTSTCTAIRAFKMGTVPTTEQSPDGSTRPMTSCRPAFRAPCPVFSLVNFGSNYNPNDPNAVNYSAGDYWGAGQVNLDGEVVGWMKQHGGVAGIEHWGLYDDDPDYANCEIDPSAGFSACSLGVAPVPGSPGSAVPASASQWSTDQYRLNYMLLGTMPGALFDGDFESGTGSWSADGTGSQLVTLNGDAVTGGYYARLSVSAPGENEVCTPSFALPGNVSSLTGYVAVGGFVRTTIPAVDIAVHFWGPNSGLLGEDDIVLTQATPGTWEPIQEQALSERAATWKGLGGPPVAAEVCFAVTAPSSASSASPIDVDLDSITVYDY